MDGHAALAMTDSSSLAITALLVIASEAWQSMARHSAGGTAQLQASIDRAISLKFVFLRWPNLIQHLGNQWPEQQN